MTTPTARSSLATTRRSPCSRARPRRCGNGCSLLTHDDGASTIRTSTRAAPRCSTTTASSTRRRRRSASARSRSTPSAGCASTVSRCCLRGACIHHDNGVLGAATIARADERRVEKLKEAGFNALRSAHHPMSRAMLERLRPPRHARDGRDLRRVDRAEDGGRLRARFPDWWQADVDAMVRKDRNHPSRDHVLHRQRDPRRLDAVRTAARTRDRREGPRARRHPPRHELDQPSARRRDRAVRRHPRRRDRCRPTRTPASTR